MQLAQIDNFVRKLNCEHPKFYLSMCSEFCPMTLAGAVAVQTSQTPLLRIGILSLQTPFQVHGFSVTGQILTAEVRFSLMHGVILTY